MSDILKASVDSWSMNPNDPKFGNWNVVINSSNAGAPLAFKRGGEVVSQMRGYNASFGNLLTDAEMVAGLDAFGRQHYLTYNGGYAVDSDPFNIGRWSYANALSLKGMQQAADKLIADTAEKQKLTSQEAIEIGKKAVEQYKALNAEMHMIAAAVGYGGGTTLGGYVQPDDGGFLGDILDFASSVAIGVAFGAAGGALLGELGGGALLGGEALAAPTVATGSGAGLIGSGMSAGQLSLLGADIGYGTALSGTAGALGGTAAVAVAGDFGSSEILAVSNTTSAPVVAGDFGSSEILAASNTTSAPVVTGDFGSSEILAASDAASAPVVSGDFGSSEILSTVKDTKMGNLSDWLSDYSSDPGPDPFATTDAVNAGWTEYGGYGVDYYGLGSKASANAALNDIFGTAVKTLKAGAAALTSVSNSIAGAKKAIANPQPNYTRAAGSMNLALPLIAVAGYLALK